MRCSRSRAVFVVGVALGVSACVGEPMAPPPLPSDAPSTSAAAAGQAATLRAAPENAVPDQYIVVFRESVRDVPGLANALIRSHGGSRLHVYQHALKGFAARLPPQAVAALQRNPEIAFIEQDRTFTIRSHTVQASAPWGVDRIDQRDLPLSTTYAYSSDGTGVNIYIVDTGIRMSHNDFGGRASLGIDYIDDGRNGGDCNGHGTHVAGNAAGATWGVAKAANLISVRVADCSASGYGSNAVAAVDWITANAVLPAVANLSFGWAVTGEKTAVEIAVENSIAAGVFYAGATANARIEACEDFPSRISTLMTVARTNSEDRMVAATGFGPCIDIFAPGQGIPSAGIASDDATRTGNGTSYATPHVAGVAALHLQRNPTWAPNLVMSTILAQATIGRIGTDTDGTELPEGTPDRLLFSPVQNVAPVASHGGPYTGSEGIAVTFNAAGSSDADLDALTYSWTFGDGGTGTGATPAHTYADDGAYTVTVTVSDGIATAVATTTATISNLAPVVNAGPDATRNEGSLFSQVGQFTDPGADSWTATVDYGDGSGVQPLVLSGEAFDLTHTYIDNGVYTVTVSVTDDDGGTGADPVTVTVLNVAPSVDAGPDATVTSGETFEFSGTFSDPGVIDQPWSYLISWGFGPATAGTTDDQSAPITSSKPFCAAGGYEVSLSVTDKDGGTGSDALALAVAYLGIGIDITPAQSPNSVSLSDQGLLPVAVLSTPTFDATRIDPATLSLGDEAGSDTQAARRPNGRYQANSEDVNGDGRLDLVVMFRVPALVDNGDLNSASTELVLRGFLNDGCTNFRGWDSVRVVP